MSTKEEIADVLEAAADLYESGRMTWAMGTFPDWSKRGCVMQAMTRATGEAYEAMYWTEPHDVHCQPSDRFLDARKALAEAIREGEPYLPVNEPGVVYAHNDLRLKSQAAAVDLLKHTAKDLRNQVGS